MECIKALKLQVEATLAFFSLPVFFGTIFSPPSRLHSTHCLLLQMRIVQARGGECAVRCLSCGGESNIHAPRVQTFTPMRPVINIGMGIGMPFRAGGLASMSCCAQYAPIFQLSSPGLAFSPSGVAGFPFPSFPTGNCSEACRPLPATTSKDSFKQVDSICDHIFAS